MLYLVVVYRLFDWLKVLLNEIKPRAMEMLDENKLLFVGRCLLAVDCSKLKGETSAKSQIKS